MSLIDAAGWDELCPPEENKIKTRNEIRIICSKAQFNRIIDALMRSGLNADGKCVLGKNEFTCHYTNGRNQNLTCTECFKKNIKHIPK